MGVPPALVTVAVKVTLSPYADGFSDEPRVVVVAGLLTVKPFTRVAVPPPGVGLVAETLRAPTAAPAPIVIFAVILMLLFTVVVFTVMLGPKFTELTPAM